MTIFGNYQNNDNLSWTNPCPEQEGLVIAELPMKIGQSYQLVRVHTEFTEAKKSFRALIKRVDIVGKWIWVLSELVGSEEKDNTISLSVKIPSGRIDRSSVFVKHYVITNGLLSKQEIPFSNVHPVSSEKKYKPEKEELPKLTPQLIYAADDRYQFAWVDECEEKKKKKTQEERGWCDVM